MYQPFLDRKVDLDAWTRDIIEWHFNPETGSPYWIEKSKSLNFEPRRDVQCYDDLSLFGFFNDKELTHVPVSQMIPRGFANSGENRHRVFETGGTLGTPKRIVDISYRKELARWLSWNLDQHGFPSSGNWLHLGPAGPHVVGYSAGELAHLRDGICYYIDIDTRWIKICVKKGYTDVLNEYLDNVILQAVRIMETQNITVLFTTPKLLPLLAEKISLSSLRGVILGGTHITPDFNRLIRNEIVPDIPVCVFYGNTIMGVAPQSSVTSVNESSIEHYGFYPYFTTAVVDPADPMRIVGYGEKGRVRISTLTKDYFIPNLLERDEAVRIPGSSMYAWDGVANVRPFSDMQQEIIEGVY